MPVPLYQSLSRPSDNECRVSRYAPGNGCWDEVGKSSQAGLLPTGLFVERIEHPCRHQIVNRYVHLYL